MKTFEQILEQANILPNLWNSLLYDSQQSPCKLTNSKDLLLHQTRLQNQLPQNWAIEEQSTGFKSSVSLNDESPLYNSQLEFPDTNRINGLFIGQMTERTNENPGSGQFAQLHKSGEKFTPTKLEDSRIHCSANNWEDFDPIFKQKKIKKSMKKNTNVPKFLVRMYMKHFTTHNKNKKSKIIEFHKKTKRQLKGRVSNNYKISDLMRLFNEIEKQNKEIDLNNREVMQKILREKGTQQILFNNYIRGNTISYMLAIKIYAIRCRMSTLTERVKIF